MNNVKNKYLNYFIIINNVYLILIKECDTYNPDLLIFSSTTEPEPISVFLIIFIPELIYIDEPK